MVYLLQLMVLPEAVQYAETQLQKVHSDYKAVIRT